jgi:hypothetical protein
MRRTDQEARIQDALNHLKRSDTVEFKMIVSESDRYSAVKALDMDVLEAELRQVIFFDTPDLKLNRGGIVLRARRIKKGGDTTVKLRPIVPDDLPDKLRRSNAFSIELDVLPAAVVCSGSLKSKTDNDDIKNVLNRNSSIRKLFLPEQRTFYRDHAPKGLDMDDLMPFGPINLAKLKFSPATLRGRMLVAELWFYPDGSRILELSTKCARDEAFQALGETRADLYRRGVEVSGDQETKTRKALQYFSHLSTSKKKKAA